MTSIGAPPRPHTGWHDPADLAMLRAVPEYVNPYSAVLLAIWIASLGFPIPEDIALLGGGLACYWGTAKVGLMIPVAMFAVLSGDLFVFFLGHRWASNLLDHRLTRRLATPERINALRQRFHRHQMKTVFVGRFLPGMRVVVFLTAGAVKMPLWRFLAANGFGALISVPTFVILGFLFGHSYERLEQRVDKVQYWMMLAVVCVATVWVLWLFYAKSARAREAQRLLEDRRKSRQKETPRPIHDGGKAPI